MKVLDLGSKVKNMYVAAGIDFFKSVGSAATTVQTSLMTLAPILFVVSIVIGGLMYVFGRRGAQAGKEHVWNVMIGVCTVVAAASVVMTLFAVFGQTATGI